MRPPDDEISKGFRREDLLEAAASEEPTADLDLGGGRRLRLRLPQLQLPQWAWLVLALLSGGTGTTVGTFLAVDWLGLRAREEASALRLQMAEQRHAYELAAIRCGCPGPAAVTP